MLTKRQVEIFLQFCEHENEYLKANHFSDELNVSLRTVQNDLKVIKKEMQNESSFSIESKVPFGTRLVVHDQNKFDEYLSSLKNQNEESLSEKDGRVHKLLNYLMKQRKSVPLSQCADYIYVSKSTLINDLKEVEQILNKFSLKLIQSVGYVWVDGLERDRRMCLIDNDNNNFNIISSNPLSDMEG
ncbi:MAG: HTH domain-containing protein, partial [Absicoccus porci]